MLEKKEKKFLPKRLFTIFYGNLLFTMCVFKSTKNYMVKSALHLPTKHFDVCRYFIGKCCTSLSGHMFNFFQLSDEGQLYNNHITSVLLSAVHFRTV